MPHLLRRSGTLVVPLLLASGSALAQGVSIVRTTAEQIFARIELPRGPGAGDDLVADIILSFESPEGIGGSPLDLSARVIDIQSDPVAAQLPGDTFISDDFPVLLTIAPNDPGKNFKFSGAWSLELHTSRLEFTSRTPLRLFRAAASGGPFTDVTESMGVGSYRVRGSLGDFSDFVIVQDFRAPTVVAAAKLSRIESLVDLYDGVSIQGNVAGNLRSTVSNATSKVAGRDFDGALADLEALLAEIEQAIGRQEIASRFDNETATPSVGGLLIGAARTARFGLLLATAPRQTVGLRRTLTLADGSVLDVDVSFEETSDVDFDAFLVDSQTVGPGDPLRGRLPAGVSLPNELQVAFEISPNAGRVESFRGAAELELRTGKLHLLGESPLRLFKASDGAPFEDVTLSHGSGSYRVRGSLGDFSEFVIAEDIRPQAAVILLKLSRLETLVADDAIDLSIRGQLAALMQSASDAITGGDLDGAKTALRQLVAEVAAHAGDGIPDLWRSDGSRRSLAGLIHSAASTLQFSLVRQQTTSLADPADVNGDGKVDVQDVFWLIDRLF